MLCPQLNEFIKLAVSRVENEAIIPIPSKVEIQEVIKKMCPTKAFGPYGMLALFFQQYWNIVESDVVRTIQNVFTFGLISTAFNGTFFVLIPKFIQAYQFNHF